MDNPHSPGKIGVTIKVPESKKYAGDNPWFVFEGTDADSLKAKIAATFGTEHEGLTLSDVVINAQRLVTGLGAVAHGLGGTVLASGQAAAPADTPAAPAASGGSVFQQAAAGGAAAAPAQESDPILDAIEMAKTVEELKQIWAENQAAFNDSKYMDPWKAKGKALSS
jgi:hypothetical protein